MSQDVTGGVAEIQLVPGRKCHGRYPVTLLLRGEVLLADIVNPHIPKQVEAFIRRAIRKLPVLKGRSDELRRAVLQLAAPAPTPERCSDAHDAHKHPYVESAGGITWMKAVGDGEVPVPLTNFTSHIAAEVVRDDGTDREVIFEIAATLHGKGCCFTIPACRFGGMNWTTEQLGAEAIVYPGNSVRDHARAAIQFLSPQPVPRRITFTHTGWRDLGEGAGGWAYLHAGGAIEPCGNVAGVSVDLSGCLPLYELPPPPTDAELQDAIHITLQLMRLAPDALMMPAFCAPWRAALGQCDFGLHLSGPTGAFKSELAALLQQHFGPAMDARHLPGSWSSTDNALEGLLFSAKDALAVVDDFAPCGTPHDVARWHQRADRVLRAQGNNAGRARMRPDGTLRQPKPPRGLVLSTGEDTPRGQSLRARILVLEVSKGDIRVDVLSACQADATSGVYATAMSGFLRWLAARYAQVRQRLKGEFEQLRQETIGVGSHCRTPEIIANLALGMQYFLQFAQEAGALTEAEGEALWQRTWTSLMAAAAKQSEYQAAAEPASRFIELLSSAIGSGRAHLAARDGGAPADPAAWGWRATQTGVGAYRSEEWRPHGERVGWVDECGCVYLDPDASYKAAQDMAGSGGDGLSVSARTLRKRLDEKGFLVRETAKDVLTVRRVLAGTKRSVLQLAGGVLCPKPDIPDTPDNNESGGAGSVRNVRKGAAIPAAT